MIALFTDYGVQGPYTGQVEAVLHRLAPRERVINLMADVPPQNVKAGAYFLAVLAPALPAGTIFLCVVDPGVGSFRDRPVVMKIDGRWFIGPDNGLFDIVARRARRVTCREITWRPKKLSASFHGRDLYAPACAMLAKGKSVPARAVNWKERHHWPGDLAEVIYIDRFGNCITGIRADNLKNTAIIRAGRRPIRNAATFTAVRKGQAFWYANSNGLVEIAVNQAKASERLRLKVGDRLG
ncbi:MAG: SAM-dependent chlorinase/fluorinase [Gammaproteobacteria bacterium]|nr:SAM-dependent chlorinase/fluorinase [Gammaproteobacteria bacterium]